LFKIFIILIDFTESTSVEEDASFSTFVESSRKNFVTFSFLAFINASMQHKDLFRTCQMFDSSF